MKLPFLLLAAFTIAAPAWAQPAPPPADGPGAHGMRQHGKMGARMKEIRNDLLRKEAGLDDAAVAKATRVHDQFDADRKKLHRELGEQMRALRKLDADGATDEAAYRQGLDRIVAAHKGLHELRAKELDELRKVLSQRQAARVLLALERIQHEMRKEMRQSRKAWLRHELDRMEGDDGPEPPTPPPPPAARKSGK